MKFRNRQQTSSKATSVEADVWGVESDVPDIMAVYLAEETLRIAKDDISASFDGCGELDASDNLDLWGESKGRKLHGGYIDFSVQEEAKAEVEAVSGFHFDDEEIGEFALAGPSGVQTNRRSVFSVTDVSAEEGSSEAELDAPQAAPEVRYVLSFAKRSDLDFTAYQIPEPLPARVAVQPESK